MPISRNFLFLIIGALVVAVGALSWKVYQDNKEPKGVQLNIGPGGISIEKK
jgi:predicted negative regulator of RcsB-dependent stress response